jgi:hypothetical protein
MYIMGMEKEISKWRIIRNVLENIFFAILFLSFFGAIYDMWDELVNSSLIGFLFLLLMISVIIFYIWAFFCRRKWFSLRR